jgi:hypothetical protein
LSSYLHFTLYVVGFIAIQILLAVFIGRFIRFGTDKTSRAPVSSDNAPHHVEETSRSESPRRTESK